MFSELDKAQKKAYDKQTVSDNTKAPSFKNSKKDVEVKIRLNRRLNKVCITPKISKIVNWMSITLDLVSLKQRETAERNTQISFRKP